LNKNITLTKIPKHIGFIIDGNGRWAKARGLTRTIGHKFGFDNLKKILKESFNLGIKHISVYAFSTENWNRPQKEIDYIFKLLQDWLEEDDLSDFPDTRINVMGDISKLPENLQKNILKITEQTKHEDKKVLNLGINYGGRDEIVMAVNQLLKSKKTEITKEDISNNIYTKNQPDPDFIIRTSGEKRISNFMLWQNAYAEWYFPKTFWPAFTKKHLMNALLEYQKRNRRFGAIKE